MLKKRQRKIKKKVSFSEFFRVSLNENLKFFKKFTPLKMLQIFSQTVNFKRTKSLKSTVFL